MYDAVLQAINKLLPDLMYLILLVALWYIQGLIKVWQPKIKEWIGAHVSEKTQTIILTLGQEAYAYAETVYRGENGADKLQAALAYFNSHMSKYGLSNLNSDVVRAAIEKAWLEYQGQGVILEAAEPITAHAVETQPLTVAEAVNKAGTVEELAAVIMELKAKSAL